MKLFEHVGSLQRWFNPGSLIILIHEVGGIRNHQACYNYFYFRIVNLKHTMMFRNGWKAFGNFCEVRLLVSTTMRTDVTGQTSLFPISSFIWICRDNAVEFSIQI